MEKSMQLFICSEKEKTGDVVFQAGTGNAVQISIDGRKIADLPIADGRIAMNVGKRKIATVKVTF